MDKFDQEKKILNELVKKHGLNDKRVLTQSQIVDKLVVKEMERMNKVINK